jgi:ATP-dependent RNA helicase DDX56/DBP9
VRCCILCPSRELARQTAEVLGQLTNSCQGVVRTLDVGAKEVAVVAPLLKDLPDIIVSTPGRLAQHLKEGNLDLSASLSLLVIDEADLIFSFGFEADLRFILTKLPPIYQAVLTSATLSEDVTRLKKLVLHNPVVLKLSEPQLPDSSQLTQYVIKLEEEDKFVLIYALFKLELIRGKTLLFVSSVDRCYKMKLYLEQFNIPCCVLNSELPVATRLHTVEQFNKGVYSVIVAADEKFLDEGQSVKKAEHKVDKDKDNSKRVKDKESGVARGIDFQFVANVVNFDFPPDPDSYIHRVGRTARGVQNGTALSLTSGAEAEQLVALEAHLAEVCGGETHLKPYQFKMDELDGFRYRARDAWRSVTKIAIREARLKEIKQEILNSQKLKSYFEDNPRDRQLLRHDKALHTVKHQEHLKNVPEYIVPETLKKMTGMRKGKGRGKGKGGGKMTDTQKKFNKRKADPLDSLGGSKKRR